MSTPSRVGMLLSDGRVKSIYVNFDGYPSYMGKTLREHWTDVDKVEELLEGGDRSAIFEGELDPSQCYSSKGEVDVEAVYSESWQEFIDTDSLATEYLYLFDPKTKEWTNH